PEGTRGPLAGANRESVQRFVRKELCDLEARRALAGSVPMHAVDETADVRGDAGRAVQPADRRLADPQAQEPQEAADVVDMGMRDEDVGDLVRGPRAEHMGLAEVEQQRAARMAEPDEQQRVAKDAVQQRRGERTDMHDKLSEVVLRDNAPIGEAPAA